MLFHCTCSSTGVREFLYKIPFLNGNSSQDLVKRVDVFSDACMILNGSMYNSLKMLNDFANTVRTIIPPPDQFLPQFHNPCWFMNIHISQNTQKLLQPRENMTEATASKIMRNLFLSQTPSVTSLVCVPKVYFIGFPRSGSTQLYKMVTKHPLISGGINKEPHWWTKFQFSEKFPYNVLTVFRYLSHFYMASQEVLDQPDLLLIDGSQSTVWDTRVTKNWCVLPQLITSIVPEAKFIVLMRKPEQRLLSDAKYLCEDYWNVHKNGIIPEAYLRNATDVFLKNAHVEIDKFKKCLKLKSLEACTHLALNGNKEDMKKCGRVRLGVSLYHVHIRQWLNVVPKEQFLFLRTDDLERFPLETLQRVWAFLKVPQQSEEDLEDILHEHLHCSQHKTSSGDFEFLTKFFQPHNEQLANILKDNNFTWRD